jgi:hypothetical protein
MTPSIFDEFLDRTTQAGLSLAERSDVVRVSRRPVPHVGLYLAEFAVPYLSRGPGGWIDLAPGPLHVAIRLGPGYLRAVHPLEIAQVREFDFFHPNFAWPVLCLGEVRPGTGLDKLLKHLFEIVTYANFSTDDGLDPEACDRLRAEPWLLDRLPRAPRLLRRPVELQVEGGGDTSSERPGRVAEGP